MPPQVRLVVVRKAMANLVVLEPLVKALMVHRVEAVITLAVVVVLVPWVVIEIQEHPSFEQWVDMESQMTLWALCITGLVVAVALDIQPMQETEDLVVVAVVHPW